MIRLFVLMVLVAGMPLWLAGCQRLAATAPAEEREPFVFVHITDPQVGMYRDFDMADDFSNEERDFPRAVDLVARIEPDFVIIGGDLVEKWNYEDEIEFFLDFVSDLEEHTTVHLQPGNHDHPPTEEGLAFYRDLHGPDYFSVFHKGSHFILLNSNLIAFEDELPEEAARQWEWLEGELETAAGDEADNVFVFVHHPFFMYEPDEDDTYFNIPPEVRVRYLDLFEEHGVDAVFAGHYHREAGGYSGDMEMIVTSSLGTPLGDDPVGLRRVVVSPEGYEHEYLPLP